ncbi:MAG: hypothetical protein KTR30_22000 [Saprospiraceae bacterium]|nr:hypothetical protein [Saprospiraceae bacterium]
MKTSILNSSKMVAIVALAMTFIFASCSKDDDVQGPTATNDQAINIPFFVQTADGQMPSDPADLLYETRKQNPLLAPDGHQITWGEFSAVKGQVVAECTDQGTKVTLNLTGLIPNGVYTIWNLSFEAPGFDPTAEMLGVDGLGAAGKGDGSDNAFTASASGTGSISFTSPGGDLSLFGSIGACSLVDNFEWHVAGAYHADGLTYGPIIGPDGTYAEQFGFAFVKGN